MLLRLVSDFYVHVFNKIRDIKVSGNSQSLVIFEKNRAESSRSGGGLSKDSFI